MDDQIAFWNGLSGERWVHEQPVRDRMLRPFGDAALDAARLGAGESVLDVGCGCGDTTVALAGQVGPSGRVLGLDVSAPMLARARERCAGFPNVELREGDAARAELPPAAFDLAYSRLA
jgi:ubiquinone/menaquinone biosynthesis C-methylase UbiE